MKILWVEDVIERSAGINIVWHVLLYLDIVQTSYAIYV